MEHADAAEVEEVTAEDMVYYAGHYGVAVGEHLLASGVGVTEIDAYEPWQNPDREELHDVSVEIDFTVTSSAAISNWHRDKPGVEVSVSLIWDALSGWKLFRYRDRVEEERWLGQGLVPAPARLEAFLLNAQMDFPGVGSSDRPYYRPANDGYRTVLPELAPYVEEPEHHARGWEWRWRKFHSNLYSQRTAKALLAGEGDPVLSLPLRTSEIAALRHVLEFAERGMGMDASPMLDAFAHSLACRAADEPASAETSERIRTLAAAQWARRFGPA